MANIEVLIIKWKYFKIEIIRLLGIWSRILVLYTIDV